MFASSLFHFPSSSSLDWSSFLSFPRTVGWLVCWVGVCGGGARGRWLRCPHAYPSRSRDVRISSPCTLVCVSVVCLPGRGIYRQGDGSEAVHHQYLQRLCVTNPGACTVDLRLVDPSSGWNARLRCVCVCLSVFKYVYIFQECRRPCRARIAGARLASAGRLPMC